MNARELLTAIEAYGRQIITADQAEWAVVVSALRLLAAAEGGDGTPLTDAARVRELEHAVDLAARTMAGEGVEDQGQAWDKCLRILDAARSK